MVVLRVVGTRWRIFFSFLSAKSFAFPIGFITASIQDVSYIINILDHYNTIPSSTENDIDSGDPNY